MLSNALSIAAFGVIAYLVIEILTSIFKMDAPVWDIVSRTALIGLIIAAVIYYFIKRKEEVK